MTRIVLGVMVVVLSGCNCTPECPELPDAAVATPQPWIGPCLQQSDCQTGLTCLPYSTSLSVCSYPCSQNRECHGGTCLLDGDAGVCMKPCEADGGCETGDLFSTCGNSFCIPLICALHAKDSCPDGLSCLGSQCLQIGNGVGVTGGFCRGVMK